MRGQIIKKFRSSGLRMGGTNELKNFGAKIWKARLVFINIPGEGYWLRDVPRSTVDYKPGHTQPNAKFSD